MDWKGFKDERLTLEDKEHETCTIRKSMHRKNSQFRNKGKGRLILQTK